MSIRILKQKSLDDLFLNVENNIDRYKEGRFDELESPEHTHQHDGLSFDLDKMKRINSGKSEDVSNSKLLFEALKGLTPYLAKDLRLWSYLSHTVLFDYTLNRWPIKEDWTSEKQAHHIRAHFFVLNKSFDREVERDNAVSRLWWPAFIASKVENSNIDDTIFSFIRDQDVKGSLLGRPNSSMSMNLFSLLLDRFNRSYSTDKKMFKDRIYRDFIKQVGVLGGSKLIPAMSDNEINQHLDKIENRMFGHPDKVLEDALIKVKNEIMNSEPNTPEEKRILNDDMLEKFIAFKPTSIEEWQKSFDKKTRENIPPAEGKFLKGILEEIKVFVDTNLYY